MPRGLFVEPFYGGSHRDLLAALRTLDSQPNNWLLSGAIDGIEARSVPGGA